MDGLDVRASSRSAITLGALAVVFVAAAAWGWSRVTEPFPEKAEAAPCTDTLIPAGDDLAPPQVMVTVLNGGGANGLASKTMDELVEFGFAKGSLGNAPDTDGPVAAQVWSDDPDDPATMLLASYLGDDVDVVDQPSGYPGVTIVVGKRFQGVVQGHPTVTARADAYVCTPPLSSKPDDAT
ncbi:LytR C-terminal domain-containing protein [Nocardioides humi]|uniref:LytR/CpsA/Psr regulator C-terminal domain-containing protein n=1 Tax=Nocardioides humi TaxID=449461 RepID=A0ABN2ACI5_9ACTN|nr:LytR C-terminal domain-containing protein [Nocardioides humi]